MKFQKLLVTLLLSFASASSFAGLSDGQAAILGIVIGSHMNRGAVYVQPTPVYVQPAPVYIQQHRPVYIDQSQESYYEPQLHGYCAVYRDEQYAQCMGNIKRQRMEDAYRRGLTGYR